MKYFWFCVIFNSYMYGHFNWLNLALIQDINTGLYHPVSLPLHFLFVTWSEEVSLFLFLDLCPLASQTQLSLQIICTAHLSAGKLPFDWIINKSVKQTNERKGLAANRSRKKVQEINISPLGVRFWKVGEWTL